MPQGGCASGAPRRVEQGVKMRGADKTSRNPVKIIATDQPARKPDWIRVRMPASPRIEEIKR
ncbi:MAG: lipoyl synthase, partial [Gammaproteobacteria bacterium]|nr:lipoyl synthase [Gammaproteobacteria bacterium]